MRLPSLSLIKKAFLMKKKVLWNSVLKFHHRLYTSIYVSSYYYICVLTLLCMCSRAAICVLILLCVRSHTRLYACLVFLPSCCMQGKVWENVRQKCESLHAHLDLLADIVV
jgi:hypothetical protein